LKPNAYPTLQKINIRLQQTDIQIIDKQALEEKQKEFANFYES
jgi:hypothetical protein